MPRYFAFLRGINVGGHRIKMDRLREHVEALGFEHVETFIASGNVIFSSASRELGKTFFDSPVATDWSSAAPGISPAATNETTRRRK